MWVPALLALLLCAVCFICSVSPLYYFVDQSLTWSEAQQFCRQHYHDLACVSSSEDNLRLPRPPGYSAPVWIGLSEDPTDLNQWKWSATNSSGSYKNWLSVPAISIAESQHCAMLYGQFWFTSECTGKLKGICYSGSSPKVYHSTPVAMTWDEALTYCRTHHTDLALIESREENAAVSKLGDLDGNWIGLFKPTGKWSDNRAVTFTAWYKPVRYTKWREPFCAAEIENNKWEDFYYEESFTFYCQGVDIESKSELELVAGEDFSHTFLFSNPGTKKTFCRNSCSEEDILVATMGDEGLNGRYRILYEKNADDLSEVTVKIRNMSSADSGEYQVHLDVRAHQVWINVSAAPPGGFPVTSEAPPEQEPTGRPAPPSGVPVTSEAPPEQETTGLPGGAPNTRTMIQVLIPVCVVVIVKWLL